MEMDINTAAVLSGASQYIKKDHVFLMSLIHIHACTHTQMHTQTHTHTCVCVYKKNCFFPPNELCRFSVA